MLYRDFYELSVKHCREIESGLNELHKLYRKRGSEKEMLCVEKLEGSLMSYQKVAEHYHPDALKEKGVRVKECIELSK